MIQFKNKRVVDVCCGGRMFYFDKVNPDVLYLDIRRIEPMMVGKGRNARMFSCLPDALSDFRKLDLPDNSFNLAIFDPPHIARAGATSYMAGKYGYLKKATWKEYLRQGFAECFRVLKPGGYSCSSGMNAISFSPRYCPLLDINRYSELVEVEATRLISLLL